MKHLEEFRSPEIAKEYLKEIHEVISKPWNIMEVCGGQTHSILKNGIIDLLPEEINLIHGPGCPVCVTPLALIDEAIHLAEKENVILCSFGDMLRVPGSEKSLIEAKAGGAEIKVVYSPLDAVKLAKENPDREIVFFAVGFETTAPPNALSVIQAQILKLKNYSLLTSHVLVPPALEAIFADEESEVDGILAAGHVCAIMGIGEYVSLAEKYKRPVVISGFEPVDLLSGILQLVKQLETNQYKLDNAYKRVVKNDGTPNAKKIIFKVFETVDRDWRGIGTIPLSGYKLKKEFVDFDAHEKFKVQIKQVKESKECIAGLILKGKKKPNECPQFGKNCNPEHPLGAPMVSSEGACAAYYYISEFAITDSF